MENHKEMINPTILVATQWWFKQRKGNEIDNKPLIIIPILFYYIDALYRITRDYSLPSISGTSSPKEESESNGYLLGMFPNPKNYAIFRSAISLTGDIYNTLKASKTCDLMELKPLIEDLFNAANTFRPVRNFFTHMDEVLADLEKHGVDGPLNTEFGVEYTESAKNRFHLIIDKETIYFTHFKKSEKMYVGKSAFNPIFKAARPVYAELTSHKPVSANQHYESANKLFPFEEE